MTISLLTPLEAAHKIRRPISSLYELVKSGKITAVRQGRLLFFTSEDIEAFIEASKTRRHQKSVNTFSLRRPSKRNISLE